MENRDESQRCSKQCWLIAGALLLVLFVLATAHMVSSERRDVRIELNASRGGVVQLFYAMRDGFNEQDSVRAELRPGRNVVDFRVPLYAINALRFDPINSDSQVIVLSVTASAAADQRTSVPLTNIKPLGNVGVQSTHVGLQVKPTPGTTDPQLRLPVPRQFAQTQFGALGLQWCVWLAELLVLGIGYVLLTRYCRVRMLVGAGMAAVAALVLALAVLAPARSVSPDEVSHHTAFQYYVDHMLPPAVDDPTVLPSISVYGYSYLMEWDVVYWVAARVTAPVRYLTNNDLYAARGFNVALWLGLLLLAVVARRKWTWVLAVLLLTPQAWYVFGYFNGDAFPLALAMVCAGLVAQAESSTGRFLRGERAGFGVLVLVIALGLLLVSKRNFLPIIPGFVLWLVALHLRPRAWTLVALICGIGAAGASVQLGSAPSVSSWGGQWVFLAGGLVLVCAGGAGILHSALADTRRRKILGRLVLLVVAAVAVAAPRIGWDIAVNGGPSAKAERMRVVAEHHAGSGFRPSDIARGEQRPTLHMASHGVPLAQLLGRYNWGGISAMSAFGVYGYMSVIAPLWTYKVLALIFFTLFVLALRATGQMSPEIRFGLYAIIIGTSTFVCLASLLHSWVGDFQSQGRYLLPILPMLALAFAHAPDQLPRRVFKALLLAAFLVGIYSMAFTALPALVGVAS